MNAMALVGMSAAGKAMTDVQRKAAVEAIVADSAPVWQSYSDGSDPVFEVGANLATAKG
jgi:hypothetical protein